jgi:hypothetical protein
MTSSFPDEVPEADFLEQRFGVEVADEDTGADVRRVAVPRDLEADEADVIEQSLAVPVTDDDLEFDR